VLASAAASSCPLSLHDALPIYLVGGVAIGGLGQPADVVADGVAGQEQLRGDQQPGSGGGGTARGLVEDLEVPGDGSGPSGALEQGGTHACSSPVRGLLGVS